MPNDRRFAVLIDADNISDRYIKIILDEISNDGVATYKRIYGDWTKPGLAPWKRVLLEYSVTPMQQYGYTTGKNATDSAMIIDAMDILYSGNVEGFCLVTSDSDFTRLASRLRESGMMVVGMGERKTPKAFISACNKFKYLDILSGQAAPKSAEIKKNVKSTKNSKTKVEKIASEQEKESVARTTSSKKGGKSSKEEKPSKTEALKIEEDKEEKRLEEREEIRIEKNRKTGRYRPQDLGILIIEEEEDNYEDPAEMTSLETIREAIATIVSESADEDEWVFIGDIGNRLTKRYPDFDVRNYGFNKLTPFIKSLDLFDIKGVASGNSNNKLVYVKERE